MWFKINYASERTVRWQSQCLVEILADTAWLELTNTSPPCIFSKSKDVWCWLPNFFFLEHSHSDICGMNDVSHIDFRRSDGRITKMGPNCQTFKVGGSPFTGCSVNFQIPNVWNNPAAVQTNHSFGLGVINHTSHDVTPPYDTRWGRTCQALDKSSMRPIIRRIQTWSKDTPANLWCATT